MVKASTKQKPGKSNKAAGKPASSVSREHSRDSASAQIAQGVTSSVPARSSNWGGARAGSGGGPRLNKNLGSLKNEVLRYRQKYDKMPLDHLMKALNDDCAPKAKGEKDIDFIARQNKWLSRQDWAAVQAAPYMHAKLASVEIIEGGAAVQHPVDLKKLTPEELDTMEALVRKASIKPEDAQEIELEASEYHEVAEEAAAEGE